MAVEEMAFSGIYKILKIINTLNSFTVSTCSTSAIWVHTCFDSSQLTDDNCLSGFFFPYHYNTLICVSLNSMWHNIFDNAQGSAFSPIARLHKIDRLTVKHYMRWQLSIKWSDT